MDTVDTVTGCDTVWRRGVSPVSPAVVKATIRRESGVASAGVVGDWHDNAVTAHLRAPTDHVVLVLVYLVNVGRRRVPQ